MPRAEGGAEWRAGTDDTGGETAPGGATTRGESKGDNTAGETLGGKIAGGILLRDGGGSGSSDHGTRAAQALLEAHGGVWLGLLRLSDEPWRPRSARGGLREEDLQRVTGEGNSSRETSLSDDVSGSGASDGNPEVTMDSQGEPAGGTATMSGDGGSVVGEDEDEAATEMEANNPPGIDRSGQGNNRRGSPSFVAANDTRGHSPHPSSGPHRGRHRKRRSSKSESRKGSFSGAGFLDQRSGRAGAHSRGGMTHEVSVPLISCSMIARPPPGDAGIPGTERGEGQARATAAGTAMPNVMEACLVSPMSDGWPDAWNPIALLRLFPSTADNEASTAFDKLSDFLTPREDELPGAEEDGDEATQGVEGRGGGTDGEGTDDDLAITRRRSKSKSPRAKSPEASADGDPRTGYPGTTGDRVNGGADVDDTGSVHSGGSMAGNTAGGPVSETGPAMRLAAARVELDGGYVAFVVSDELLPADVRRSVVDPGASAGFQVPSRNNTSGGKDGSEGSDGGSGKSSGTAEGLVNNGESPETTGS